MNCQELLKRTKPDHPDHALLNSAAERINEVALTLNAAATQQQHADELRAIEEQFRGAGVDLVLGGRHLVKCVTSRCWQDQLGWLCARGGWLAVQVSATCAPVGRLERSFVATYITGGVVCCVCIVSSLQGGVPDESMSAS